MKRIFILLIAILELSTQSHAQCNDGDLRAKVGDGSSKLRVKIYKHKFNKALHDQHERMGINFTESALHKLLDLVNEKDSIGNPKYDGLRAYFAVNPNSAEAEGKQMTMVFVPTIGQPDGTHMDDTSNCRVIKEDSMTPLPLKYKDASDWVREFQVGDSSKYTKFNIRARTVFGEKYNETKSLWYQFDYLCSPSGGVLSYLNCPTTKLKGVKLKFGAFGIHAKKYTYHLTILFTLIKSDGAPVTLSFSRKRPAIKNEFEPKDLFNDPNVDTGIPCPPPPSGEKCPGTLLPQE